VRLELLGTVPYRELGTQRPASGVDDPSPALAVGEPGYGVTALATPAREGTRLGWRGWFAVLAVSCSLLGQGERCRIERTYRSPCTTLQAYWEALRAGDADGAWACFAEGRPDVPMPGSVWFLPSKDDLWLTGYRALPVAPSRVMVSYEVHYRDGWSGDERMFRFGNELVRQRGEWHIAKSIGEASMPEWKPKDRPVDS
jgi:hypothetical protein